MEWFPLAAASLAIGLYLAIGFGIAIKDWLGDRRGYVAIGRTGLEPGFLAPYLVLALAWPVLCAAVVLLARDDEYDRSRSRSF